MSDPFIGQVIMFGGNFAPRNWAFCDGQLLQISSFTALFSILGTTYGGDGRTTFGLPELRGRAPVHPGNGPGLPNISLGERGGAEIHTLSEAEMPSHSHTASATSDAGTSGGPTGLVSGRMSNDTNAYGPATNLTAMNPAAVTNAGGGQDHNNMHPFQAVNFIIALVGTFPSRN